jgi:magnesium transporter
MLVDEAKYIEGRRVGDGSVTDGESFTWIGLVDATEAELQKYQRRFHLNNLAIEDAASEEQRSKLDIYPEHLFLVLKTIAYDMKTERIVVGDVALFLGDEFVLTVRHGEALALRSIRADLENHPQRLIGGPTAVLHEVVDRLVDQYVAVSAHIAKDVEVIEDLVFDDEQPASAGRLYFVKRELIEFRRAIFPLVQPIELLAAGKVAHFNTNSAPLFSDVRDHLLKVIDEVELMNELIDAALHANSSLIQVQQNTDMRKISAWVGIGAVPTMVAGIYGMNFDHMPELRWRYGYFIVVGLLVGVCATLFRVFRKNEWL